MAKGKYRQWIAPEGLAKIKEWAEAGLDDGQIQKNMGISSSTFYAWAEKYPEISESLSQGRGGARVQIENALFQRALGGEHEVVKAVKVRRREYDETTGRCIRETEEVVPAVEIVYTPPDVAAIKFWLTNRAPERWSEKIEVKGEGQLTLEQLLAGR